MKKYCSIALLFLFSFTAFAQSGQSGDTMIDTSLYLRKVLADANSKPEVWNDYFILTYSNPNTHRFVGVAFEHENYNIIHSFTKNENNTYVYHNRLPNVSNIKYRLVVDSVWQADPKNPLYEIDKNGVRISVLPLPDRIFTLKGPQVQEDGTIDFYLNSNSSNASVFVVGNFSHWDPFMYPMTEVRQGLYKVTIPLSRGLYYYSFIINGKRILDPDNLNVKYMQSTGERVNELDTRT